MTTAIYKDGNELEYILKNQAKWFGYQKYMRRELESYSVADLRQIIYTMIEQEDAK